ncbi:cation:proton antiporter [Nakamurella endophytica]|uniref:Potassium transporter n=1 Tax=Nakamurella endophytica TaxID=1748367 RepID=A0A917WKA7_9ACTN|nr:cation:proton antiporter [Nakamurella endophytica]GGM10411.1 potassium transporter [Nakamurella endophytica]
MHSAVIFMELGAVILVLGLLGRLAGRIGLSPVPFYLLAGLAFGDGGLLPLGASESFISTGAEIGVVLLLLLLGLEYSAPELMTNLRQQAPAGIVNLVANSAPGVAVGLILGWSAPAVVAMGGITYATSSGITAKLLGDLGRLGNRETPVVLSLLVLEDLSMAVYLPVLTALLAGAGLLSGTISVGIALVAITVALVVALRFGQQLGRLIWTESSEVLLLIVFGLALLVAGAAQQLQVSEAVGAFLVGIALSGRVAQSAYTLLAPLRDLFAAVFFVFFGLQTHPGDIPGMLLPALALGAVTALTKIGVGVWATRRTGIGPAGQIRAGTVIVSRGEFNIVVAGLATGAAGVVAPGLGALAATYVLIMAVAGPLVARAGDPLGRWVARRATARREDRATGRVTTAADPARTRAATAVATDPGSDAEAVDGIDGIDGIDRADRVDGEGTIDGVAGVGGIRPRRLRGLDGLDGLDPAGADGAR